MPVTTELPMITTIINLLLIILSSDTFDCAFPTLSRPFRTSPSGILCYFGSVFSLFSFSYLVIPWQPTPVHAYSSQDYVSLSPCIHLMPSHYVSSHLPWPLHDVLIKPTFVSSGSYFYLLIYFLLHYQYEFPGVLGKELVKCT